MRQKVSTLAEQIFSENSCVGVQNALIRHLREDARKVTVSNVPPPPEQLAFDPAILGVWAKKTAK